MPQYPCPTDATIAPRSYTLAMRLCSSELCVKSNMAPCPPARHIASYVFGSTDRMGGVFFRSAMRSWLFSQDFALSLRNGNFRERGSKGTSPPRGLAMSCSKPLPFKPIPSGRQPRKPQPRRVTIIVLTHIRHDVQDSFSHESILAGAWACIPWTDGSTTFKKDTSPRY